MLAFLTFPFLVPITLHVRKVTVIAGRWRTVLRQGVPVLPDAVWCWARAAGLPQDSAVALAWLCLKAIPKTQMPSPLWKWRRGRVETVPRGHSEDTGWDEAGDGATVP